MKRFVSLPEALAECRPIDSTAGRKLALYRLKGARKGPVLLWGHAWKPG